MVFSKLDFSWSKIVKEASINNNNNSLTNITSSTTTDSSSPSSSSTTTAANRPFPGAEKFGDPKWFWWYVSRYLLPSNWAAANKKSQRSQMTDEELLKNIAELNEDIDKIEGRIIANVDIAGLFKVAPKFTRPSLQLALGASHPERLDDIPRRDEEEKKARIATKGIPRGVVTDPIASAIHHLSNAADPTNTNTLFSVDEKLTNNSEIEKILAGCFVVDKATLNEFLRTLKRFIIDARESNATLKNLAIMKLFTLEALMNRFAQCKQNQQIYALSADLRHWFHQIPLPDHLRKYFSITYKLRGENKTRTVYPRAWPMGFHSAPGVGQAATWAMLLADLDSPSENSPTNINNIKKLKNELGIYPEQKFDEYITWLPLRNGGGVFVLIDNIFIITSEKSVCNKWKHRIVEQTNRFRACLKRHDKDDKRADNKLDDVEEVLLNKNSSEDTSITFSGINFNFTGRKVNNNIQQHPELLDLTKKSWTLSYRKLAAVLGQTLWFLRVHGKPMIELVDFIELYRKAHPKDGENWNDNLTLEESDLDLLRKYYNFAVSNIRTDYPKISKLSRIVFVATDAAKDTLGFMYKIINNNNLHNNSTDNSDDAVNEWKKIGSDELPKHEHKDIWKGELEAVLRAFEYIIHHEGNIPTIFFLAIDNNTAKHTLHRGFSTDGDALLMLREITTILNKQGSKLVLDYIKSQDNPSDELSRGKEVVEEKAKKLEEYFLSLTDLAKADLLVHGKDRMLLESVARRRPQTDNL